uniref:Uncharacterized protein n=1 Tax=Candidatus Kentrum sp. TC TaxID=2126339 RepID=A0A450ZPY9_9GAMM|nr:MAG: hypothetical protein BECKTC1821F_GA0114240_100826 [Candidatus Kentron sp. TC]
MTNDFLTFLKTRIAFPDENEIRNKDTGATGSHRGGTLLGRGWPFLDESGRGLQDLQLLLAHRG